MKRYFDRCDREQIFVCLFDRLQSDPTGLLADIYRFLGVDDTFQPDISTVHNPGGLPKRRWLQRLLITPSLLKKLIKPIVPDRTWVRIRQRVLRANITVAELAPPTRQRLKLLLKDDILALQELIGLDLKHWLK